MVAAAEDGPDLETAATLRLCRGAQSAIASGTVSLRGGPLTSAVDVAQEILVLTMLGFDAPSFANFGGIGSEYQRLVGRGAAAVFDATLTNRGFPRDAPYWEGLRLPSDPDREPERELAYTVESVSAETDVTEGAPLEGFRSLEVHGRPFMLASRSTLVIALARSALRS